MRWPPDRRRARRGQAPNPSGKSSLSSNSADNTSHIEFSQLRPRPPGPGERARLAALVRRAPVLRLVVGGQV